MLTDEEESGSTTSSCDEKDNAASDTASAASPHCNTSLIGLRDGEELISRPRSQSDDKSLISSIPTASGMPTPTVPVAKITSKDEYDSSATETADEENESPTTRNSPKALLQPAYQTGQPTAQQATITVVTNQNGPPVINQPSRLDSMGDVMLNVIEQMVKNNGSATQKTGSAALITKANTDNPCIRDYRMGESTVNIPVSCNNNIPQNSLATLSVVNSHGRTLHRLPAQQILSSPQIAATITPVQSASASVPKTELSKEVLVVLRSEPEPETLDLSIKKSRDNSNFLHQSLPPPAHSKTSIHNSSTGLSISSASITYRPSGESAYAGYHHESGRISKSPSVFVSAAPQPHGLVVQRPSISTSQSGSKISIKHNAMKPCTKVPHSQTKPGSITHGTPMNPMQGSVVVNTPASPRYDNLQRQTQIDSTKSVGSITQGTPVHLPPHHLQEKRMYDYYNKRQSPAQLSIPGNLQISSQSPSNFPPYAIQSNNNVPSGFTSSFTRPPTYNIEQQLSSRQIIITDYITSQQMHGQGRRTIEKEPVSRGPIMSSPASMYYGDKDRNTRQEYLSRASPAEIVNR